MGKTTHYHPVSLHVLRGAAEYCGWKFGKITQVFWNQVTSQAEYICEIEKLPRAADQWPVSIIQRQLQHCFMDDITVKAVWIKPGGQWMARIRVDISVTDDQGVEVQAQQ